MLPRSNHPNLLIGPDSLDDAGVYQVNESLALVQTVDFFTPIVDDAYDFGRVSAANSLSDVYAMGANPVTALNIVAFPEDDLPVEVLADILRGSADICETAGVAVAGGHSVSDKELKFGLAVTGLVDPRDGLLTNAGAKPGDILLLTKPLGTGLISNAMMNDAADSEYVMAMTEVMVRLNRAAAEEARRHGVSAVTDITGFGLLGHAREMAHASRVTVELQASALPALPGALDIAASGSYFSGGERRNLKFVQRSGRIHPEVPEAQKRLAADPQTSGGLLIAIPETEEAALRKSLERRGEKLWRIGEIVPRGEASVVLHP